LIRLNTNGISTPASYGGIVSSTLGITDAPVYCRCYQPTDKSGGGVGDFLLDGSVGRFNPDGSLDTTFGNGGFAISRS